MTRKSASADRRRVSASSADRDSAPFVVVREPDDMGAPFERCAVCRRSTVYWHAESNTPVCLACAEEIERPPKREIVLHEWSVD